MLHLNYFINQRFLKVIETAYYEILEKDKQEYEDEPLIWYRDGYNKPCGLTVKHSLTCRAFSIQPGCEQ